MSYSDAELRIAVDEVFKKFDADHNNSLDKNEVTNLINEALTHLKAGKNVTQAEVETFIKATDTSGDGRIQKS
jgi:Ca2+-binding EF-hand superfamily protein